MFDSEFEESESDDNITDFVPDHDSATEVLKFRASINKVYRA